MHIGITPGSQQSFKERRKFTSVNFDNRCLLTFPLEPRTNDQAFQHQLDMYNLAAQTKAAAILFAVCKGKISEGLDFGDANARAVLIVGVPFPNLKDMKVSLKMEYNTQKKKSNTSILSGDEWYNLQAFRAVNQGLSLLTTCLIHISLGTVYSSQRRLWSTLILIDARYSSKEKSQKLSKWVRSRAKA